MASARSRTVYRFGEFTLDLDAGGLSRGGASIALRPKAFDLLALFAANAGRVLGKDEILDTVWDGVTVTEDSLTQCVSELRHALGEPGAAAIRTVPRRGYVFSAVVEETGPGASDPPITALAPRPTLAVLPFLNRSSESEQDYFAEGVTEGLVAALGLIRELSVTSGAAGDTGARYRLDGSVRAAGDRIRVAARLIDTETGTQLWAEHFDGGQGDLFAFQDEITRRIAIAVQVKLTYGDMAWLWDGRTRDLRAWEKLAAARDRFLRWTEADNRQAQALLLEALDIDPAYTAAMVLLGWCYWWEARAYASADRDERLARAGEMAERALAAAPDLGNAHTLKGGIAFLTGRFDEALAHCRRGCHLSPGDSWLQGCAGLVNIYAGEPQAALAALDRARRLSPTPPNWVLYQQALATLWAGDLAEAAGLAERYRAIATDDPYAYVVLATICAFGGREDEAAGHIRELARRAPEFGMADIRRSQRYKDRRQLDRVVEALRTAGLPG